MLGHPTQVISPVILNSLANHTCWCWHCYCVDLAWQCQRSTLLIEHAPWIWGHSASYNNPLSLKHKVPIVAQFVQQHQSHHHTALKHMPYPARSNGSCNHLQCHEWCLKTWQHMFRCSHEALTGWFFCMHYCRKAAAGGPTVCHPPPADTVKTKSWCFIAMTKSMRGSSWYIWQQMPRAEIRYSTELSTFKKQHKLPITNRSNSSGYESNLKHTLQHTKVSSCLWSWCLAHGIWLHQR